MLNSDEMAVVYEGILECFKETREKTPRDTVDAILKLYEFSDVAETFAALGRIKKHDNRIYGKNREWLNSISVSPENYEWQNPRYRHGKFIRADHDAIHPTHINQIVTELRERKEAETAKMAKAMVDMVKATSTGGQVLSVAEEKKKKKNEGKSKLIPEVDAKDLSSMRVIEDDKLDIPDKPSEGYEPVSKYYNDVVKRASAKYLKEKQRSVTLRFKKEDFEERIAPAIKKSNLPTMTFIKVAIDEKIERDGL